jgi:hypothetical protein
MNNIKGFIYSFFIITFWVGLLFGAQMGEVCGKNDDCQYEGGECVEIEYKGKKMGICTKKCQWSKPDSCGEGFYCKAPSPCSKGICLKMAKEEERTRPLGNECDHHNQCKTSQCIKISEQCPSFCSQPCDPNREGTCPSGFICEEISDDCGVCARELHLKCKGEVKKCNNNKDCASGEKCFNYEVCAQPCGDEEGKLKCNEEEGFKCIPNLNHCFKSGYYPLGVPCEKGDECLSKLCATKGEESFCTKLCEQNQPYLCPDGFKCVPAEEDKWVCVKEKYEPYITAGCGCNLSYGLYSPIWFYLFFVLAVFIFIRYYEALYIIFCWIARRVRTGPRDSL